jgi:cyanate permease
MSSVFAFVSGVILLGFIVGALLNVQAAVTWPLGLVLGWGAMFAVGLILWSLRNRVGHLIGNPTLSMVGQVSGTIITSVALDLEQA